MIDNSKGENVKPIFSQFKPNNGENINPLTGNPEKVAKIFKYRFLVNSPQSTVSNLDLLQAKYCIPEIYKMLVMLLF